MNYQIEARPAEDLIIVRHFHYYSAEDLQTYLDDLTRQLRQHSYRRLLADYSGLVEVKLNFIDKIKIIATRSRDITELSSKARHAIVVTNAFQKAMAQQARTISTVQTGKNVLVKARYFSTHEAALEWLMHDQP